MAWPVETWKTLFDWGSVILVCLTVFTGAGALITGKIIGDRQDKEIARLNNETAKANLELARLKAPRALSPEQQARVSLKVKDFSGTPFDLASTMDSEATNLCSAIEDALVSAGWTEIDPPNSGGLMVRRGGKKPIGTTFAIGLAVEIHQSRAGDLLKPTEALVAALKAEGLEVTGLATITGTAPNAVHIHVGRKF